MLSRRDALNALAGGAACLSLATASPAEQAIDFADQPVAAAAVERDETVIECVEHRRRRAIAERVLLRLRPFEQPGAQDLERLGLVLVLRFLVLAAHDEAGRQVRDPDGRVGRVDALPARTR